MRKYARYVSYRLARTGFIIKNHVSGLLGRSVAVLIFDVDSVYDVEALPELMDLLATRGLAAGFAVVGEWAERYPDEHRLIAAGGHEVINHGFLNHCPEDDAGQLYSCNFLSEMDLEGQKREVRMGHDSIARSLGVEPRGFRGAHFSTLRRAQLLELYPFLKEMGYLYCSSSTHEFSPHLRATPAVAGGLVELPITTCPEHPFSPFDSWHFLEAPDRDHRDEDLLGCVSSLLGLAQANPGFFLNIYLDPRAAVGSSPAAEALSALASSKVEKLLPAQVAQEVMGAARR